MPAVSPNVIHNLLQKIFRKLRLYALYVINHVVPNNGTTSTNYWSNHMVVPADDRGWQTDKDSLNYFKWRNSQYPGYIYLMPVQGFDDKVILDYGCGPGHDLVGFSEHSNPKKIIATDVSLPALELSKTRLDLHKFKNIEYLHIEEKIKTIPLEDNSVDHIHSSGVLHHCYNLDNILQEFYRILKPNGTLNIMVYNGNSLWVHLYVAWIIQIKQHKYSDLSINEAFRHCTDGADCPISKYFIPEDFISLMKLHGFTGNLTGVAISKHELSLLSDLETAAKDQRLDKIHRDFLNNVMLNIENVPLYKNTVAGIDSCYRFHKSNKQNN